MKKLFGILTLSFTLSLTFMNNTSAQTMTGCNYWGKAYGCDRYDCGDCVFMGCGEAGGFLICGFEEVDQ
ncbi:hypothetical protein MM213_09665 [Belliella sp. R4-6]|uniref:Uncharacterized protein n=1 Tax=Belliella alkalica TaxID=1730871 RepID=A0ABS9VBD8_9BACT|nr:hypothetical protein [Belliella alkalica]MCH7413752.1 hypothetical protein [Belliella alkalica]